MNSFYYTTKEFLFKHIIWLIPFAITIGLLFYHENTSDVMVLIIITLSAFTILIFLYIYKYFRSSKSPENQSDSQKELTDDIGKIDLVFKNALKQAKADNINLIEIPFIILIGEPASGKTTALDKSEYFIRAKKQDSFVNGVENEPDIGTQNFNWFIESDSIFFDIAGELAISDKVLHHKEISSNDAEKKWDTLLRIISKHRKKCPINSIIITIPMTSLLGLYSPRDKEKKRDNAKIRKNKAAQIKKRLNDIYTKLQVRVPVYFMISKLDLIYGFEQFHSLIKTTEESDENKKLFGFDNKSGRLREKDFDDFKFRLYNWVLNRLHESDKNQTANNIHIFQFINEFEEIKKPLFDDYLKIILENHNPPIPFYRILFEPIIEKCRKSWNRLLKKQDVARGDSINLFCKGCFFTTSIQPGHAVAKRIIEKSHDDLEKKDKLNKFRSNNRTETPFFLFDFFKKINHESDLVKWTKEKETFGVLIGILCVLTIFSFGAWCYYFKTEIVAPLDKIINDAKDCYKNVEYTITYDPCYNSLTSPQVNNFDFFNNSSNNNVLLKFSDILKKVDEIILHRKNFDQQSSWFLFLPQIIHEGINNRFNEDNNLLIEHIKNIEKEITLRGLILPILHVAMTAIDDPFVDKEQLLKMLKVCCSIFCQKSPVENEQDSFIKFHDIFIQKNLEAMIEGLSKEYVIKKINEYPPGPKNRWNIQCYEKLAFSVRKGVSKLYKLWLFDDDIKLMSLLKNNIVQMLNNYNELLEINKSKENAIHLRADSVLEIAKSNVTLINTILQHKKLIKKPTDILGKCNDNYDTLIQSTRINGNDENIIPNRWYIDDLNDVLNHHKSVVCKKVYKSMYNDWKDIKVYPFANNNLLNRVKQNLSNKAESFTKTSNSFKDLPQKAPLTNRGKYVSDISNTLEFNKMSDIDLVKNSLSLVVQFKNKLNQVNLDKQYLVNLNSCSIIHKKCVKIKQDTETNIQHNINQMTKNQVTNKSWKGWRKKELYDVIIAYLNNEICMIDKKIIQNVLDSIEQGKKLDEETIQNVLKSINRNKENIEKNLPLTNQEISLDIFSSQQLISYIDKIERINNWTKKNVQMNHYEKEIKQSCVVKIKNALSIFIKYWEQEIRNISHVLKLQYQENNNEWQDIILRFRKMNDTIITFLHPDKGQLNNLLSKVKLEDLDKLQIKFKKYDLSKDEDLSIQLKNIKKTCSVFKIKNVKDNTHISSEDYKNDVITVQDEYIKNIKEYPKINFDKSQLYKLSSLYDNCQGTSNSGEILTERLKQIGNHFLSLYEQSSNSDITDESDEDFYNQAFTNFLNHQKKQLFDYDKYKKRVLYRFPFKMFDHSRPKTVDSEKLKQFFKEYDTFLQSINIKDIEDLKQFLDKNLIKFIKECIVWRRFLYNDQYEPRTHDITISYNFDKHKNKLYYAGNNYNLIEIEICETVKGSFETSNIGISKTSVAWSISSNELRIRGIDWTDTSKIAEKIINGCNLSLIGYAKSASFYDFQMDVIRKENQNKCKSDNCKVLVPLSFKCTKTTTPDIIEWPK
ncbi:type VI secretion protein VasK [Candidatus Magnetomorum sp. HK-1]|nr:type VI secretion protein VasK [Candidatus Magnetomorum sp. HK-1]